ncbi:22723_t:CDS:2, partial [Gigaspora margarita]
TPNFCYEELFNNNSDEDSNTESPLIASDLEKAMTTSYSSNIPNNNLYYSHFYSSIFGASATFNTTSNSLSKLEYYLDL